MAENMKILSFTFGLLLLVVLGCPQHINAQQMRERIVKKTSWPNEPLQIIAAKIEDRAVKFGQGFPADDDWWCNLKLSITNASEKDIIYFEVNLVIYNPEASSKKSAYIYTYIQGPSPWFFKQWLVPEGLQSLKAKETKEIEFEGFSGCELRKEDLRKFFNSDSIDRVEVLVRDLAFDRDLVWRKGQILRRDAKDPYMWRIIGE